MQFEDIEMLDIPESDPPATHSLPAADSHPPADSPPALQAPPAAEKSYPLLQEWLSGEKDLRFQFSAAAYEASLGLTELDPQVGYINRLYKIVEEMKSEGDSAALDPAAGGPFGVINRLRDNVGAARLPKHALQAFRAILSAYSHYYESVVDTLGEADARDLTALGAMLDCLHANTFYASEQTRPELILKWINSYDPKPENDFIDAVMYNTPTPWKHPQFWTLYMGTLLSRGMFEKAASSIAASKYHELQHICPSLHEIIEDLEALVGAYAGMALKGEFVQWKLNVCEFRDNFGPMRADISDMVHVTVALQIHDLLRLMSGMPKTAALFVLTWSEMYASLALFQVRDDDSVYADYFRIAVAEKGYNVAEPVEEAFRDILLGNYLRVILAIDRCDSPTAAYVSKLFDDCGFFLPFYRDLATTPGASSVPGTAEASAWPEPAESPDSLRHVSDYLLVRHAYTCLEVHELVPVGIGLLVRPIVAGMEAQARDVVAQFLPHYSYATNDDLEWALTICAKLALPEVGKRLFKKQGMRSLENGHLFEALNMLVKSYDHTSCTQDDCDAMAEIHSIVWDSLFADTLLNSIPVPDELITNVVTGQVAADFPVHPIIRQSLLPYAVLCEYLATVADTSAFARSLTALFHLIRFKYMPEKFVPLLLAQFLPFFLTRHFDLPQLIIITELIDNFEGHELAHEDDGLYEYAVENVPTEAPWDWRVEVLKQGGVLPKTVKALVKDLRNKIARSIGEVYINT